MTPQEIQSDRVHRVKAVLTSKVKDATYTLVIAGQYANHLHIDTLEIGRRNLINFEAYQSKLYGKKMLDYSKLP
jgi:hypothetical protein